MRNADCTILDQAAEAGISAPTFEATRTHLVRGIQAMRTQDSESLRERAEDVADWEAIFALLNPYRQPCGRVAIGPGDV